RLPGIERAQGPPVLDRRGQRPLELRLGQREQVVQRRSGGVGAVLPVPAGKAHEDEGREQEERGDDHDGRHPLTVEQQQVTHAGTPPWSGGGRVDHGGLRGRGSGACHTSWEASPEEKRWLTRTILRISPCRHRPESNSCSWICAYSGTLEL